MKSRSTPPLAALFAVACGDGGPPPDLTGPITGGEVACEGGKAAGFPCNRVSLVSYLPLDRIGVHAGGNVSEVWGWTDPSTGTEWALVGHSRGTAFISLEDPENPVYVGFLRMPVGTEPSLWRDIKVYRNHAYVVADGTSSHGLQVFDLAGLRDVTGPAGELAPTATFEGFRRAHNIAINEETGFAYVVGGDGVLEGDDACEGLHMIDLRDPASPANAGCFEHRGTGISEDTGYTHDVQCVVYRGPDTEHRGKEVCFGSNESHLSIADVSDKGAPTAISKATYPDAGYIHQGWLDGAQEYFYVNDETDELDEGAKTRTIVWDVKDLDDPVVVAEYHAATEATDHNLYVKGSRLYQANYKAGFRVLDISNRTRPREVGFLDTMPYEDDPDLFGAWGSYPWFRSGVVPVTSMYEGIFFLRPQ